MPSDSEDDPIADAVLSDDPETGARYAGWASLGRYSLGTKLRGVGTVGGLVAAESLAVTTLRAARLRAVLGTAPLSASVSASVVLAAGLKFLTIGTAGLVLVGVRRRLTDPDGRAVERLLGLEETAALLGLVTGGAGCLVGMGLLALLATADPGSVAGWRLRLASPVAFPVTYGVVLWWSSTVAVGCFSASVVFDDDLPFAGGRGGEN